ncbi:MAG: D-sedoheptulose 7-phosphate isomerase [Gammaproteobacteria bacterium]|nr:D-sedoheptulose 7-phosphate isomerase [Gammaproteobacteria bacterium]
MTDPVITAIEDHAQALAAVRDRLVPDIQRVAHSLIECIRGGGTIFWCGNGGSAADAQHIAAELIGRFERDRKAMASIALTTDTSILTSVGNDYGFDSIFQRQVEALVRPGDVLVGLSTSGNSPNVLRAIEQANGQGATTIGLLGRDGGQLKDLCRLSIVIPAQNTARIQEMHGLIGHILCDLIEQECGK